MEPVRLAVIGARLIGAKHAALVHANEACVLVGISDTDPARMPAADGLGVAFYRSAEELIKREQLAGAIIATCSLLKTPSDP